MHQAHGTELHDCTIVFSWFLSTYQHTVNATNTTIKPRSAFIHETMRNLLLFEVFHGEVDSHVQCLINCLNNCPNASEK